MSEALRETSAFCQLASGELLELRQQFNEKLRELNEKLCRVRQVVDREMKEQRLNEETEE